MTPRKREFPTADLNGESINPNPIPHTLGAAVDDALATLAPEDQDILRAYFWERQSYAQIAKEAGLAGKQGAAWRVTAALARLKTALRNEGVTYGESPQESQEPEQGDQD